MPMLISYYYHWKDKAYIPTNTSNGFKGSEFLVRKIFDNTSTI